MSENNSLIWHPFTPLITDRSPIEVVKAKGMYLHTADGRKILDAVSSWWVNIHGHGNEYLAKAIYDQALEMEHVIFAGFTHRPAQLLTENLKTILPQQMSKFFFSDDGSTSVEVALKMAFQFWYNRGEKKRTKVIALQGAYHGDTFGAMSVGDRCLFTEPFFPLLFDIECIDFPTEENEKQVVEQFEKLIERDDICSFIFEPLVQGAGGMRMYSPEVLDKLISLAKAKNIICIADEVMTGFGRTGKLFATDHLQNDADIMCLSKGITGGTMAMGMTVCSEKIVEAFESDELSKALLHGHSYTGNPLACSVANASFELLMNDECTQARQMINESHLSFTQELSKSDKVEKIRVLGTILAFDIKTEGSTSYDNKLRKNISTYFLDKNILIRPLGNVIYILPPYVVTRNELQTVYTGISNFLSELG